MLAARRIKMKLRPVTDADSAAVVELIDSCLREIGDRVFPEGEGQDLMNPEASYAGRGGAFVFMEDDTGITGTHAVLPTSENGTATFRRLYVRKDMRGHGVGKRLMQWAIDEAIAKGFERVVFWSDTRFAHAHEFFRRFGFVKGETRDMDDGAVPYSEFRFERAL
ncbi:MAG: hypothetical protein CMO80_20400 [Verrucomicrobiales bacterium]|nr:hypothetical protein [Verrucomicrobiales bacterium]